MRIIAYYTQHSLQTKWQCQGYLPRRSHPADLSGPVDPTNSQRNNYVAMELLADPKFEGLAIYFWSDGPLPTSKVQHGAVLLPRIILADEKRREC